MKTKKYLISIAILICVILVIVIINSTNSITYSVAFESKCGNIIAPQTIKTGENATEPRISRSGYTLEGWYFGENKWNFTTDVVTSDITLTAKWIPNSYVVSFNSTGGNAFTDITVHTDESMELPTPSRAFYNFIGWYLGDKKISDQKYNFNRDIELTAKWERIQYEIHFNTNGGQEMASIKVDCYSQIDELPIPEKSDHEFLGWHLNGNKILYPFDFTEGDLYLEAVWGEDIAALFEYSADEKGNGIKITKYLGNEQDIIIPKTLRGKTITTIAENTFIDVSAKSITFSAAVQNFEYKSLYGCNSLEKLNIAGNTTATLVYMFGGENNIPSSLKEINFVDGSTTYGKNIFNQLTSSRTFIVHIYSSLEQTPVDAFYNCHNISELYFPEELKVISDRTVCNMDNLVYVNIPSSVTTIGMNAFINIPNVSYLIIPKSTLKIEYAGIAATDSIIFVESTSKPQSWSEPIFSIYENEMNIYYGFEEIRENNDFVYAVCKAGSVKNCIILKNKTSASIPETIDGYVVTTLKT